MARGQRDGVWKALRYRPVFPVVAVVLGHVGRDNEGASRRSVGAVRSRVGAMEGEGLAIDGNRTANPLGEMSAWGRRRVG